MSYKPQTLLNLLGSVESWTKSYNIINHNGCAPGIDDSSIETLYIELRGDDAIDYQGNILSLMVEKLEELLTPIIKENYSNYTEKELNLKFHETVINDFSTSLNATCWNDQPIAWATFQGTDATIMVTLCIWFQ